MSAPSADEYAEKASKSEGLVLGVFTAFFGVLFLATVYFWFADFRDSGVLNLPTGFFVALSGSVVLVFYVRLRLEGGEGFPIRISGDLIHFPRPGGYNAVLGRGVAVPVPSVASVDFHWGVVAVREPFSVFLPKVVLRTSGGAAYTKRYKWTQTEIGGSAGELAAHMTRVLGARVRHLDADSKEPFPTGPGRDLDANGTRTGGPYREATLRGVIRGPAVFYVSAWLSLGAYVVLAIAAPWFSAGLRATFGDAEWMVHLFVLTVCGVLIGTIALYLRLHGNVAVPVQIRGDRLYFPRKGAWDIILNRCVAIPVAAVETVVVSWASIPIPPDVSVSWIIEISLRTETGRVYSKKYLAGVSAQRWARATATQLLALFGHRVRERYVPIHGLPAPQSVAYT